MRGWLLLAGVVTVAAIGGAFWLWQRKAVLFLPQVPAQRIARWEVMVLEGWELEGPFYELGFDGLGVVGSLPQGPTVLALSGRGRVAARPDKARRSGRLVIGPTVEAAAEPLPPVSGAFREAYIRLSPDDPGWIRGEAVEDPDLVDWAEALHAAKGPLYLSDGELVRLPMPGVRVLDLETDEGRLLILDAPEQSAVYRVSAGW